MAFDAHQRVLHLGPSLSDVAAERSGHATANGKDAASALADVLRRLSIDAPNSAGGIETIELFPVDTPLGPMIGGTIGDDVCLLEFMDRRMLKTQLARLRRYYKADLAQHVSPAARRLAHELGEYFDGTRRSFEVQLGLRGTPFQQRAWQTLLEVPYAETRSYAAQARAIGTPDGVRAVARANGDNRIAIVVPCHRIIGSDGALTGYGGGVWRKQWLLEHEKAHRLVD